MSGQDALVKERNQGGLKGGKAGAVVNAVGVQQKVHKEQGILPRPAPTKHTTHP